MMCPEKNTISEWMQVTFVSYIGVCIPAPNILSCIYFNVEFNSTCTYIIIICTAKWISQLCSLFHYFNVCFVGWQVDRCHHESVNSTNRCPEYSVSWIIRTTLVEEHVVEFNSVKSFSIFGGDPPHVVDAIIHLFVNVLIIGYKLNGNMHFIILKNHRLKQEWKNATLFLLS